MSTVSDFKSKFPEAFDIVENRCDDADREIETYIRVGNNNGVPASKIADIIFRVSNQKDVKNFGKYTTTLIKKGGGSGGNSKKTSTPRSSSKKKKKKSGLETHSFTLHEKYNDQIEREMEERGLIHKSDLFRSIVMKHFSVNNDFE